MAEVSAQVEYRSIVATFRALTCHRRPETGVCCERVRDGAPECCYLTADGIDQPTYTIREAAILHDLGVPEEVFAGSDGLYVLNREVMTPEVIKEAMHTGWMADTLECASHPTRPVIVGRRVVAVVVINACNGMRALAEYGRSRDLLRSLWQDAYDLTGPKPYYATQSIKPGWMVL